MKSLRTTSTVAVLMLALGMGAANAEPAKDSHEMVVGQIACVTFPAYGPQTDVSLIASGTAGVLQGSTSSSPLNLSASLGGGGLQACDAFASQAKARIESVGCVASQINATDPDASTNTTWARRGTQFVCSGLRDKVVDALARIVELIVTSGR